MENEEMITRVRSVMLCLTAHPHYEEGSEFQDRVQDLLEIEAELKSRLCDVTENHRNQIVKTLMDTNELLKDKLSAMQKEAIESTELISSNIDENLKQFKTIQELSEINLELHKNLHKMKQSSTVDAFIAFDNKLNTDELMAENRNLVERIKFHKNINQQDEDEKSDKDFKIKEMAKKIESLKEEVLDLAEIIEDQNVRIKDKDKQINYFDSLSREQKRQMKEMVSIAKCQETKILNQKNEIKRLCKQLRNMPK